MSERIDWRRVWCDIGPGGRVLSAILLGWFIGTIIALATGIAA